LERILVLVSHYMWYDQSTLTDFLLVASGPSIDGCASSTVILKLRDKPTNTISYFKQVENIRFTIHRSINAKNQTAVGFVQV